MLKQKLLFLYLGNSMPDSPTIGWAMYDGTGKEKPNHAVDAEAPYKSALHAMQDGWRIIHFPVLGQKVGRDLETDYLEWEFILEKLEPTDG